MAKKVQKERKTTARPKKKVTRPRTTRTVKKSVVKKKTEATKKGEKKSELTRRPKEMSSKEWLEAFFFSLVVVQLQAFFRWCWENIDQKQTREIAIALYREIFFPFESMPEHKRLPIGRHRKMIRFIHGLTSAHAARLEKITRQWAEETGQSVDPIRSGTE